MFDIKIYLFGQHHDEEHTKLHYMDTFLLRYVEEK